LSTAEHYQLLDELAELGALWICYSGGEIFARRDFLDIYRYAKTGFASIDPDDFDRMKWYGVYRQKPKDSGYFMMRLRIPAGEITSHQLRGLAGLAEDCGNGGTDITTRANLQRVAISADAVLCRTDSSNSFKDVRFEAVTAGTPPSPLPALRVVMWVGDNIQDFPRLRQDIRSASDSAFAEFGDRFIVLPNPMYGSWERNALP